MSTCSLRVGISSIEVATNLDRQFSKVVVTLHLGAAKISHNRGQEILPFMHRILMCRRTFYLIIVLVA